VTSDRDRGGAGALTRPYVVLAIAASALAIAFQMTSLLWAHRGDPIAMIRQPKRDGVTQSPGFDGQFFLVIAKDPLIGPGTVVALDSPLIRARRIGFPLAAWLLSHVTGGAASALLVVVALSSLAVVWLLQASAARDLVHPAFCLAVPLALPFVLSMELVTCEVMAAALLVAGAAAEKRRMPLLAATLIAAACLTKEVAVVAVLSFMVSHLCRGKLGRSAIYAAATVPLALWNVYVAGSLGGATRGGSLLANLTIPGVGLFGELGATSVAIIRGGSVAKAAGVILAISWLLVGAGLGSRLVLSKITPARVLAFASGVLVLLLSRGAPAYAYNEVFNFGRQLFLLPTGLAIVFFTESRDLSLRTRTALAIWLVTGAALGVTWWGRTIWVLASVAGAG